MDKMDDSCYLHRGNFDWEKAALRTDISTVQGKAFSFLRKLETIRAEHSAFRSDAKVTVLDYAICGRRLTVCVSI